MITKLPEHIQKYIFKEYLGERISLSILLCVSKKFSFISYHKSNHVKCYECGWFIKNFPRNHDCDTPNCMLIKYTNNKSIKNGTHSHKCKLGAICK
jgi:hypothetical protein